MQGSDSDIESIIIGMFLFLEDGFPEIQIWRAAKKIDIWSQQDYRRLLNRGPSLRRQGARAAPLPHSATIRNAPNSWPPSGMSTGCNDWSSKWISRVKHFKILSVGNNRRKTCTHNAFLILIVHGKMSAGLSHNHLAEDKFVLLLFGCSTAWWPGGS